MKILKHRCLHFLFGLFLVGSLLACHSSDNSSSDSSSDSSAEEPQNNSPVATDDYVTLVVKETVKISVLDNDTDTDGSLELGSLTITQTPQHGSALIASGKIDYTPDNKYAGSDQIVYQISDNDGALAKATVFLTINLKTISLTAESAGGAAFYKDGTAFYRRHGGGGGGRGFNIAVIDNITGELIEEPRNYDTWGGGTARRIALADYINYEVPVGAIVMLAVGDSAGNYGPEVISVLENLGATQASDIGWRHTWAMIVIKGDGVLDEVRANGHRQKISASADITLNLEDPHGDTRDTATLLEFNDAVLGYLYENETDMFRFNLPHDGVLRLWSSKPDEALTTIMDSFGQPVTSSLEYKQFADKSIKRYLASGVYYAEVKSLSSLAVESFVLKHQYTIDPPLPDDLTFFSKSNVGSEFSVNGEIFFARRGGSGGGRGFNIAVVDPLTGYILMAGKNYDTWAQGETAGNALSDYINGLADGLMLLLAVGDSAGYYGTNLINTLSSLGATQASDIGWRHTWAMIAIKGDGVLDEVRINGHRANAVAEAMITVPGHDRAGVTSDEAIVLEVNSFTPSYLHENEYEEDVDFYYFVLLDPESIKLESRGEVDTMVSLYELDVAGDLVLYSTEDHGGMGDNFLLEENLAAGTYYIEITGHGTAPIGQYDLLLTAN